MTKQEKLTKLIETAVENGWKPKATFKVEETELRYLKALKKWNLYLLGNGRFTSLSPSDILFSHDFAKAIWGEEEIKIDFESVEDSWNDDCYGMGGIILYSYSEGGGTSWKGKSWIYHLQQAVISEDPLQYYWENK